MMKAKTLCCSMFVVVAVLSTAPLELSAQTLGMMADNSTASVTVFDADTNTVLGTVPITPGPGIGDVLITLDLKRGFVTNFDHKVFVIDLTTSPPSLAAGTNPIPISNSGEDLTISTDGKSLIVSGGITNGTEPTSVIDIATQAEISTFSTGADTTSVEVCTDGSVLATFSATSGSNTVRRLTLSAAGTLTDTGEVLSVNNPLNVYCAPGAASGVAIGFFETGVTSFTIPGLAKVDNRSLSGRDAGMSGVINPSGSRIFVRSSPPGSIDVFDFNSATGALGTSPLLTIPVADATFFFGMEQIALHPNGEKLYVSEPGAVNVYNSSTGALLASITDPAIVTPTGVAVVTQADPCAGAPPAGAIVGTNGPDILNGTPGNDTIFGLDGSDVINGGAGNDLICGGSDNDTIDSGPGNDTANGGGGSDFCAVDASDTVINCP